MNILISRYRKTSEVIDGHLTIDGSLRLCDTAENTLHSLPAGKYRVSIIKCEFHSRKKPCIMLSDNYQPSCKDCCKSDCSGFNSTPHKGGEQGTGRMLITSGRSEGSQNSSGDGGSKTGGGLLYCPQITPGNGAYNRTDGAILVGTFISPGCLKHPKLAFDNLYDRIRKSAERGHEITLTIVENYPLLPARELTPYQMGCQILKQF